MKPPRPPTPKPPRPRPPKPKPPRPPSPKPPRPRPPKPKPPRPPSPKPPRPRPPKPKPPRPPSPKPPRPPSPKPPRPPSPKPPRPRPPEPKPPRPPSPKPPRPPSPKPPRPPSPVMISVPVLHISCQMTSDVWWSTHFITEDQLKIAVEVIESTLGKGHKASLTLNTTTAEYLGGVNVNVSFVLPCNSWLLDMVRLAGPNATSSVMVVKGTYLSHTLVAPDPKLGTWALVTSSPVMRAINHTNLKLVAAFTAANEALQFSPMYVDGNTTLPMEAFGAQTLYASYAMLSFGRASITTSCAIAMPYDLVSRCGARCNQKNAIVVQV
ncbi:Agglutinin receptor [Chlorella vulgaris]